MAEGASHRESAVNGIDAMVSNSAETVSYMINVECVTRVNASPTCAL